VFLHKKTRILTLADDIVIIHIDTDANGSHHHLHVMLIVVFCSMTSHATVSRTYKVAMNTTGSKMCVVDQPTTVIPMAASTMTIQCGVKCNEDPSCKLFQMKEDLKQCDLFTYLLQNFAAINHCTAYAAPTGKHVVLIFTQNLNLVFLHLFINQCT